MTNTWNINFDIIALITCRRHRTARNDKGQSIYSSASAATATPAKAIPGPVTGTAAPVTAAAPADPLLWTAFVCEAGGPIAIQESANRGWKGFCEVRALR
jgi:hypothetical protein